MSIHDVAKAAGVSAATVSRVFSGRGYVSDETRQRVMTAAKSLDFTPKAYKKQDKRLFCSAVGVVIPDICNHYYMEVIHGMERVLEPRGIEIMICNTDEDPRKEARCLSVLQQAGAEGIIVVPVSDAEQYNAERLIAMNEAGFPVVLLDRDVRGSSLDGVFMDNFNSAYQSVSEFIKNGHTHIAIIAGPLTSTSGMARLKGYTSALKDNGLPVRGEYILLGDFKFDLAYSLTKEMLSKYPKVTAIFASNSRMSSGCLAALRERNVKIPEDMAFISCGRPDGSFEKISVVLYPAQAIGEACASLLLEKIQGGKKLHGPGKQVTFDMQLKLCGSEVYPINRKRKKRS